jgi:hypothetical protein
VDLTGWLLRRTPPHLLLVDTPGGTGARLAVERVARERGWRLAASPAEANLLVVAGPAGSDFVPYVDAVWRSVPAPRVRVQLAGARGAEDTLTAAVAELRDPHVQRSAAIRLAGEPAASGGTHHQDAPSHDHGGGMHAGHDMDEMELPGGIAMADRAADRDGLILDQLRVPLGPVLPDWPAGLVLRTTLQGDVIQDVTVDVLASQGSGFWHADELDAEDRLRRACARRLDGCGRLLAVAGWEHAAACARSLRDGVLSGRLDRRAFERWARRVRRSRVLRWSLAGLGVLTGPRWEDTEFAGDAIDRLSRWIEQAGASVPSTVDDRGSVGAVLDVLPELLVGTELATARLVVASLDPDLEVLAGAAATHG